MSRRKPTDTFADLKKLTETGAAKMSLYLTDEEIVILDAARIDMGGVIPPSLVDVVRHVVREYKRLKEAEKATKKNSRKS